jgi:hypothetical protein
LGSIGWQGLQTVLPFVCTLLVGWLHQDMVKSCVSSINQYCMFGLYGLAKA